MLENLPLRENRHEEKQIEEILFRAVNLFEKTGLKELAEKWDTILKMYAGKKELNNPAFLETQF
jgi:outer membrane protein assembly factor BamD (BamD/ComL family)